MKIRGEQDITSEVARKLREDLGLAQWQFWNPIGVDQSAGCKIEANDGHKMRKTTRILLYVRYVAGLHLDSGVGVDRPTRVCEEVLGHARDLVAALGDVGRVVLAATAANVEPELGSGIEAQVRVVDKRELGDVAAAVRWLHRATDDDRWALAATRRSDQR